jgi:hypothetical protein
MKRKIFAVIFVLILVLTIPVSLLAVGFLLPPQYGNTYYAELPAMYDRICKAEGKRIIFIGNSAMAFGLDVNTLEAQFEGYTVCSFGLYGAIGTKAMMDICRSQIREEDIIVLAPEQDTQSLSLYFNAEYLWNALDGNFRLLKTVSQENAGEMVGSYVPFASRKYKYYRNGDAPDPSGVYAKSSFDGNCQMIYERNYNCMSGAEQDNPVCYDKEVFSASFGDYVNEYNKYVDSKGAKLLYGFAPVNLSGVESGTTQEEIEEYYDYVESYLDCSFLGDPLNYFFEREWFYDSNFHMNTAGMTVFTRQLICDLKAYFGDSSYTDIENPEKPALPDDGITGEDGVDADKFEYEEKDGKWTITGLTAKGKRASSLVIPDFYQGKKVVGFSAETFADDQTIEKITLGKYIASVKDHSFNGCVNLKMLCVNRDNSATDCAVYFSLLNGAPQCYIYVPAKKYGEYSTSYWWSRYAAYLRYLDE